MSQWFFERREKESYHNAAKKNQIVIVLSDAWEQEKEPRGELNYRSAWNPSPKYCIVCLTVLTYGVQFFFDV